MNYHNITKEDVLNGEGVRVVLWVSGCPHHCKGCHNPETWPLNSGIEFDEEAREELFEALNRPYISGITFSGGDPLHPQNREEITKLSKLIREKFPTKNQWLYTGYLYSDVKDLEIMKSLDVIVTGEYQEQNRSPNLPWVGSHNQRVIRIKDLK